MILFSPRARRRSPRETLQWGIIGSSSERLELGAVESRSYSRRLCLAVRQWQARARAALVAYRGAGPRIR